MLVDGAGNVLEGAGGGRGELQALAGTAQVREALERRATEGLAAPTVAGSVAVVGLPVTADGETAAAVGLAEPTAVTDRQILKMSLILTAVGLAVDQFI